MSAASTHTPSGIVGAVRCEVIVLKHPLRGPALALQVVSRRGYGARSGRTHIFSPLIMSEEEGGDVRANKGAHDCVRRPATGVVILGEARGREQSRCVARHSGLGLEKARSPGRFNGRASRAS
jgi:hypothetical protein